jgi:hypothetical protein
VVAHGDAGGGGSGGGSSSDGAGRRAGGGGDRGGRGYTDSHVSGVSRGGYDARRKIEEIRRKKSSTTSENDGFPAFSAHVNTKNWYRKGTDLWAEFGKGAPFGRKFSSKDSAKILTVGNAPSFGRRAVCA